MINKDFSRIFFSNHFLELIKPIMKEVHKFQIYEFLWILLNMIPKNSLSAEDQALKLVICTISMQLDNNKDWFEMKVPHKFANS